ncbi:MAG: sel1 repeat family protein [Candidatus Latescibacteria bacterium]|nr:sel1 repeat family protein [Candidatus Latescibacterota bacterium]
MRYLFFIFSLCLIIAPLAWGDYQDGRKAYNQGDYATALKELRPLAEQGHAGAQYFMGYMYYKGQGVAQDGEEAIKWLRLAAEQGDVKSQVRLGVMYRLGLTVLKNYEEAEKWLRMAAEQEDTKAQYKRGYATRQYRGCEVVSQGRGTGTAQITVPRWRDVLRRYGRSQR